ncbi:hypothetical protein KIPB_003987 [Kipferlia bialata]|uniref:Uncharacterized protein n=1 Tax=Kipferlia bialata TaxID=797122 RepID=A0A9K3CTT2_9EUKA|nr:hypothetical protein KIPB_003987 [Kipferlia bialata]|eukprot:g3987.t1
MADPVSDSSGWSNLLGGGLSSLADVLGVFLFSKVLSASAGKAAGLLTFFAVFAFYLVAYEILVDAVASLTSAASTVMLLLFGFCTCLDAPFYLAFPTHKVHVRLSTRVERVVAPIKQTGTSWVMLYLLIVVHTCTAVVILSHTALSYAEGVRAWEPWFVTALYSLTAGVGLFVSYVMYHPEGLGSGVLAKISTSLASLRGTLTLFKVPILEKAGYLYIFAVYYALCLLGTLTLAVYACAVCVPLLSSWQEWTLFSVSGVALMLHRLQSGVFVCTACFSIKKSNDLANPMYKAKTMAKRKPKAKGMTAKAVTNGYQASSGESESSLVDMSEHGTSGSDASEPEWVSASEEETASAVCCECAPPDVYDVSAMVGAGACVGVLESARDEPIAILEMPQSAGCYQPRLTEVCRKAVVRKTGPTPTLSIRAGLYQPLHQEAECGDSTDRQREREIAREKEWEREERERAEREEREEEREYRRMMEERERADMEQVQREMEMAIREEERKRQREEEREREAQRERERERERKRQDMQRLTERDCLLEPRTTTLDSDLMETGTGSAQSMGSVNSSGPASPLSRALSPILRVGVATVYCAALSTPVCFFVGLCFALPSLVYYEG